MKNLTLSLITVLLFSHSLWAQNVNIPDPNFKAALLANPAINTNGDEEIQVAEAEGYEGAIFVSHSGIEGLTGLEAFVHIDSLDCSGNDLEYSLDLAEKPNLVYLSCRGHVDLYDLDVSGCPSLRYLNCSGNDLSRLDLCNNPALEYLNCSDNYHLENLYLFSNPELEELYCSGGGNDMSSLYLGSNPKLKRLGMSHATLDHLDLSANPALEYLYCFDMNLRSLNIQNGNNANLVNLQAKDNYLDCIQVDDPSNIPDGWRIDFWVIYSDSCGLPTVDIPDPNFKAALLNNPAINTNGDGEIQLVEAQSYAGPIRVNGLNIADLTGIEAFIQADSLDCSFNQLSTLDLRLNQVLKYLNCASNQLTNLELGYKPKLEEIFCFNNQLTALDVGSTPALRLLNCSKNQLTVLGLLKNPALEVFICADNQLTALNLSSNPALRSLEVGNNSLTNLDLSANHALENLHCSDNQLSLLNINSNPGLEQLYCSGNMLESLEVRANPALLFLDCSNNQIAGLDISANPGLHALYVSDNRLAALNLQNGNNTHIEGLAAWNNPELTCIQVDDPAWAETNWRDHVDSTAVFSTDCEATTGTAAPPKKASLTIYPNPTTGLLTLNLGATYLEVTVEIRDVIGRTLVRKVYGTTDQLNLTLNGPAGLYWVIVRWRPFDKLRVKEEEMGAVRVVKF